MTGKWSDSEDAETLLKLDSDDVYGDFEDLESGKKFEADEDDDSGKFPLNYYAEVDAL